MSTSRGLMRRGHIVGLLSAAAVVGALATAADASAAVLPSSTTLTAAPASSTAGTAVTLTATVKVLGSNGLGVTPTGTVAFTSKNAANVVASLGSAPVGSCLLTVCKAVLTTSSIPVGTVSATGTYSGDGLVAGSSGSTAVTVTQPTSPGTSSTVTCYAGQPCDTGTMTSTDNTTKLDVKTAPSSNTQTVSGSLSSGSLHCYEPPEAGETPDGDDDDGVYVGALATFSSTATDAVKTITKTGTGSTGTVMRHQLGEHPTHAGCYASPNPFKGFTGGTYGNAPFIASDGMYEALLGTCTYTHNVLPCMKGVAGSGTTYSYVVTAPAGDPKFI